MKTPYDMKSIGIACDHAGYEMKEFLVGYLGASGYEVIDYGCFSPESVDYPDYAHALARGLEAGECPLGVALCGSANGISMTLNKHRDVRAAVCWTPEIAALARQHNDANVCSLPARFLDNEEAVAVLEAFLSAEFEGGRHERRVKKIPVPAPAEEA